MPRLRKNQKEQQHQQNSISIGNYMNLSQPINQNKDEQSNKIIYQQESIKKSKKSSKKQNKSIKKQGNKQVKKQINKQTKKLNNRSKSKRNNKKNLIDEQQTTFQQVQLKQQENNSDKSITKSQSSQISIKVKKPRKRSQRKQNNKNKQTILDQNQNFLQDKQILNREYLQIQQKSQNKSNQEENKQNQEQSQQINFNNRRRKLRKDKQKTQININAIFSKYTQDEQQQSYQDDRPQKFSSDTQQYELLLNKKKQKKLKKQKQIKVKNKYFSDITIPTKQSHNDNQTNQYNEQPPQNDKQLIFQRKQPSRKNVYLDKIIQQRVQYVKGKRQYKNVQTTDYKFKNHIRQKLQQVQDAEEVQVDIQLPNVFTKKSTSAALYMKNIIQKEEKMMSKNNILSQSQSGIDNNNINQNVNKNLNKNVNNNNGYNSKTQKTKTNSAQSINLLDSTTNKKAQQINTKQLFKNRKKGVKRQDYFSYLIKQIKTKKTTQLTSQQIKQCFKTSDLNDFKQQLQEDIMSNNSSNISNSINRNISDKNTHKNYHSNFNLDRKLSRQSNKSQQSNKSNNNLKQNIKQNPNSNQNKNKFINDLQRSMSISSRSNSSQKSILKSNHATKPFISSSNIDFRQSQKLNRIQKQMNFSISQDISNEVSSNLQKYNTNTNMNMNNVNMNRKQGNERQINLHKLSEQLHEKLQVQQQQQKQIKKKDIKSQNQLVKQKQKQKNKSKRSKRSKKSKKNKNKNHVDQFFQIQADFSSSEQGHSDEDSQKQLKSDQQLDQQGNILDLIDRQELNHSQKNEYLIRQKFLQDEREQDQKILQKIMKGMYGKNKYQISESEKRLRQRMNAAARKNRQSDDDDQNYQFNKFDQPTQLPDEESEKNNNIKKQQMEVDIDQTQLNKFKQLQQQVIYGGYRPIQPYQNIDSIPTVNKKQNLFFITATLPVNNIRKSIINPKTIQLNKKSSNKKSIHNRKSIGKDQVYVKKSRKNDITIGQAEKHKNKLQKTNKIQLDLRNKNVNIQQFEI